MKIYKKYTVYNKIEDGLDKRSRRKYKKVPEVRRMEVHVSEIVGEYLNKRHIEDQVSQLTDIVKLLLEKSRKEAIKVLADRFDRYSGFLHNQDWVNESWEWEFAEE